MRATRGCGTYCTLEDMTVQSFNVPFYNVAKTIGPCEGGRDGQQGRRQDDVEHDGKAYDASPRAARFDSYVGFGQYPISVMDHATGTGDPRRGRRLPQAALRGEGRAQEQEDRRSGKDPGRAMRRSSAQQVIKREVAEEVTGVLKKIAPPLGGGLGGRRQDAAPGKTV